MPSLIERLTKQNTLGRIVYGEQQISVVDCIANARAIRQRQPQLFGQKVQLSFTDIEMFVTGIIALDGWCVAIYLCPSDEVSPNVNDLHPWPLSSEISANIDSQQHQISLAPDTLKTKCFIATSGTTGKPKWFAHSFRSLTASVKQSANLQALCWGLLYQPFRFAGLQVVLQALLSGADLVDLSNDDTFIQLKLMQQHGVTAVSATPSLWRQMLMTNQIEQLALRHLTLGGEIADQGLLDHLKNLFPNSQVRHIYASTEAGVGFVVSDGKAGFPLKWLQASDLVVELKISAEQHLLVKPLNQMDIESTVQLDEQGFMDTQDRVEVINDRILFLGRATGIINVGGNKVHPEKVEQVLLSCEGIIQAQVYAKKSALMGELVVADIVLVDKVDSVNVKQQALTLCKKLLQRFEIPTKITVIESIAHNPSGKLNRKLNGKQKHD